MMRIGFTGDICFSGAFEKVINGEILDPSLRSLLMGCDYVVGNIEGPITDSKNVSNSSKINLKSGTSCLQVLKDLNINVWNLANNHINDYGRDAMVETMCHAENMGCLTFGTLNKPYIIITDASTSRKTAVIGLMQFYQAADFQDYLLTNVHEAAIKDLIRELRESCDTVILNYHGYEEYVTYPIKVKYDFFERMLDNGVDMVVGHHPHVPQGYKSGENGISIFSLGNFIFDIFQHRWRHYTDVGQILVVCIGEGPLKFELVPFRIDRKNGKIFSAEASLLPANCIQIGSYNVRKWNSACYKLLFVDNIEYLQNGLSINTLIGLMKFINRLRRLLWSYFKGREAYRPVLLGALKKLIVR